MENRNPYVGVARLLVVHFPAPGNHVRHFASCYKLLVSLFLSFFFAALNASAKVPQQIGCFIEQYRDPIVWWHRSYDRFSTSTVSRRLKVFSVCFCLFFLHHRAHRHRSHGVSRISWRKSRGEVADPSLFAIRPCLHHDTAAIPFFFFF